MNQKEFSGSLEKIDPAKLLDDESKNTLDNFFLVLAVIYNDLKGLVLFQEVINKTYRKPRDNEESAHAGEYNGIGIQTTKLLIGTMHELFRFLKDSEKLFLIPEFNEILNATNSSIKSSWNSILDIALERVADQTDFSHNLMLIRNHAAFHYKQSSKEFGEAYKRYFFRKDKVQFNSFAGYSIGPIMEETRFYYADAVVEEYLRDKNQKTTKDKSIFSMNGYSPEMIKLLIDTNHVISRLLKSYLKKCKYRR